jgi:hypothetical protein
MYRLPVKIFTIVTVFKIENNKRKLSLVHYYLKRDFASVGSPSL